jgi:uncharacterized oxidoreductase
MNIKNKTILITGAGSGIGLEAIKHFLEEGCKVIICGRNNEKLVAAKKQYPSISAIQSDLSKEEDVVALHKQIKAEGGIDILYNNAAVINFYDVASNSKNYSSTVKSEIDNNFLAVVRLIELFLPDLQTKSEAAIINTTSVVAYLPAGGVAGYSASKAALHSYTLSLRSQLVKSKSNIKVFELFPPTVDTEAVKDFDTKKIPPSKVVTELIKGLKNDKYNINVDIAKMFYFISRFAPSVAFKMLNK